ncbi:MAG: nitrogenase component 1 [Clostridium sp.]
MELYKYFPVASDRMGIIWTLSSIEGGCIIEFGPAGTTHYAIEAIGALNGEDLSKVYSTHISEEDIAFGDTDRLVKSIKEVDENIKPKYIFIMGSSISSIIGSDIKSIATEIKDSVKAKLIPIDIAGLKDDYNKGVEEALYLIGKNIIKKNQKETGLYNIIGSNIDVFNFEGDSLEIKRIMKDIFDKELNTVFTASTSIEKIENASKAELNIVLRKEGVKLAEYMEKNFDIPYIYMKPIGLKATEEFIKEIKDLMDYEVNEEALKREVCAVDKIIKKLRFKLMALKNKNVAIFADEDTLLSMRRYMKELGFNIHRAEVLHSTNLNDEEVLIKTSEYEREIYLRENELALILGDGVTLAMKHKGNATMQISNPNLDKVNIYSYTPFVGFRGALYILEKVFNIKNY